MNTLINDYFGNPLLRKIRDEGQYSIYIVRIKGMTMSLNKLLIAVVPRDVYTLSTDVRLEKLNWMFLQTRQLEEQGDIPSATYIPKNVPTKINRYFQNDQLSRYKCETYQGIEIVLLENKNAYDYGETGTISGALETYNCVIEKK